jgi:ArsR family transcriptional regulator
MSRSAAPSAAPRLDALLGWMDGLADPTRLRILRVLEREELSVLDLCGVLQLPQSTVSRHLKTLSDQGWLQNRREGTASLYRLADGIDAGAQRLWRVARAEVDGWDALEQDGLRLERVRARRSQAEAFFAGAASDWDRVRSEVYGTGFVPVVLRALVPPTWTIADLGCGTGAFALELASSGARIIGVDRSAAMLKVARRRTRQHGNVELHQASLDSLPVLDRTCDAAILLFALSYVSDVDTVLREAFRILKPGGRLVAVDAYPHGDESLRRRLGQTRPGLDPAWLRDRLAAAGFQDVEADGPIGGRRKPARPADPELFLARGVRPDVPRRAQPKER